MISDTALADILPTIVLDRVVALCVVRRLSGEEASISRRVANILRADGLDVEEQIVLPGRSNIIARFSSGRPGPRLLFNGHLDTLPLPPGYTREPYRAVIEGDR